MCDQHHFKTLANSVLCTFQLRVSENTRDMFDNECTNFCTIGNETKRQVSKFLSKFILQASDWEGTTAQFQLAEKLFKTQIKFTRLLISSMMINDNHPSTKIKEVNEQSCNLSKLIIETQLLENNTNIIDFLESDKFEIIRLCRNAILEETNKR